MGWYYFYFYSYSCSYYNWSALKKKIYYSTLFLYSTSLITYYSVFYILFVDRRSIYIYIHHLNCHVYNEVDVETVQLLLLLLLLPPLFLLSQIVIVVLLLLQSWFLPPWVVVVIVVIVELELEVNNDNNEDDNRCHLS